MKDCSVCAGQGKPISGKPCVCGGTGTIYGELQGIRRELIKADRVINAFRLMLSVSGVNTKILDNVEAEARNTP